MPTTDEEIIEFALRWEPYDGGEEDMLPKFGLAPRAFYRRVLNIVEAPKIIVAPEQQRALRAWCVRHLALITGPRHVMRVRRR